MPPKKPAAGTTTTTTVTVTTTMMAAVAAPARAKPGPKPKATPKKKATPKPKATPKSKPDPKPKPAAKPTGIIKAKAPARKSTPAAQSTSPQKKQAARCIVLSTDPFARTCTTHPGHATPKIVGHENRKGNAGRRYYVCSVGCFLGWGDMIGVVPGNPECPCGVTTRREGRVYGCANEKVDCGWRWTKPDAEVWGDERDYELEMYEAGGQSVGRWW